MFKFSALKHVGGHCWSIHSEHVEVWFGVLVQVSLCKVHVMCTESLPIFAIEFVFGFLLYSHLWAGMICDNVTHSSHRMLFLFFCHSHAALNALWAALKNCSNNTVCSVHVPLRRTEVSLLSLDSLCHPGRVRYSVFSHTLYISINTLEI